MKTIGEKPVKNAAESASERAVEVLETLAKHAGGRLTHLAREGKKASPNDAQALAFRVLTGTILSHRTRDERTEKASDALLSKYSTPEKLAEAPLGKIVELIKPVGFYNSKARYLKKCCEELVKKFGGNVPQTMEELTGLTGVGRKTAGCVLAYAFHLPAIPVDTHVHRVSNRLGLVESATPEQTELELMKTLPKENWVLVNELLVLHGQNTCVPLSPFCSRCPLNRLCPRVGVKNSR